MTQSKNITNLPMIPLLSIGMANPMLRIPEWLNKKIRRRTRMVGIFLNPGAWLQLVTAYLVE